MPRSTYTVANWYWLVGGDATQVYSSAAGAFVPVADATYQAWLAAGHAPTAIDTTQSLSDVLSGAPGLPAVSDTLKDAWFASVPRAVQVWAFAVENRVRTLEGQPQRTQAQFKNYVKGLM